MIGHQEAGGNSNIPRFEGFFKHLRTHGAIRIIRKIFLGPSAAVHHRAPRIRIFYSKETRHNDNCLSLSTEKAKSRLEPFFTVPGSPRKNGNCGTLAEQAAAGGAGAKTICSHGLAMAPCNACETCQTATETDCMIDDPLTVLPPVIGSERFLPLPFLHCTCYFIFVVLLAVMARFSTISKLAESRATSLSKCGKKFITCPPWVDDG